MISKLVADETELCRRFYTNLNLDAYSQKLKTWSEENLYPLEMPEGKIIMLGTHNAFVFEHWRRNFGAERVVGYDIINPNNHPAVLIRDLSTLNESDNTPLALCCNDLPQWIVAPKVRKAGYVWSLRNIVEGGYYIDSPNHRCGWDLKKNLESEGFEEYFWSNLLVIYRRTKKPR